MPIAMIELDASVAAVAVILLLTIALIVFLCINRRNALPDDDADEAPAARRQVDKNLYCCGAHEVCEAETLLTLGEEIIYYSDEELDAYRGREADNYTDHEIEEFRDVLLTLQLHEVTGWLKSLGLRQIEPPTVIRDEALMIVEDFRRQRRANREAQLQQQTTIAS